MFTNEINLIKASFMEVPTENPVHFRPFQSHIDAQVRQQVYQLTNEGTDTGSNNFSSVSGSIISPSAQSKGEIVMPYGWEQRRYSVILIFDVATAYGIERQVLSGYTGYMDNSLQGNIDPDAPLFINSHTMARPQTRMDNYGRYAGYASSGAKQILNPISYKDAMGAQHDGMDTLVRPKDTLQYYQLHLDGMVQDTVDGRTYATQGYTPSNRDNVIGSRYLSKVFNGYRSALAGNASMAGSGGFLFGEAATTTHVTESVTNQNLLFNRLSSNTQYGQVNSVTLNELNQVWGNLFNSDVFAVVPLHRSMPQDKRGIVSGWNGANKETQLAYFLSQSIPALMAQLLLSTYSFTLHNRTLDGSIQVATTGGRGMMDLLDIEARFANMESSLTGEIAAYILSSGVGDFLVNMTCNSLYSNDIAISINGDHVTHQFSAPAYCDSMYSPVIGGTSDSLASMGSGIGYMLTEIYGSDVDMPYNEVPNTQINYGDDWDEGVADQYTYN